MALALLAGAMGARAQTPETEDQRRRTQQEELERRKLLQAPNVTLEGPPAPGLAGTELPQESPCFRIDRFEIDLPGGGGLGPFRFVQDELARYRGRCMGREGVNLLVRRLTSLILAKGYTTTRIGIPEQDLGLGTLHLALIPGMIHAIRFSDESLWGTWTTAFPARPGDVLNLRDLEQGLEQMKRVPGQDVDIRIQPAEKPGESDIILDVHRGRPWHLDASLDDSGSEGTGHLQAGMDLSLDNPLGLSDILSVNLNRDADGSPGNRGTRGSGILYSVPSGYWTFSCSASRYQYHQNVALTFQDFTSSGTSRTTEFRVVRLIHRDQVRKDSLQFRTWERDNHSYLDDTEIDVQRFRNSHVELAWIHQHTFGRARLDLTLAWRRGTSWFGAQDDMPSAAPDSPTFYYRMETLDATLAIPFEMGGHPLQYLATLRGQYTSDTLYSLDQFTLGNRWTVRGFDGEMTLAAERGWYLRNELDIPLGQGNTILYLGADGGKVYGPSAGNLLGTGLAGAVVGCKGNLFQHLSYDLFVGCPLDQPPGFRNPWSVMGFSVCYRM